MTHPQHSSVAPCIVDVGTVVTKRDMARLLADLGRVHYLDIVEGRVQRQGEGYVIEVYEDLYAATVVINRSLYLNVNSFDYLNLDTQLPADPLTAPPTVMFDLVQENRILRLIPLSDPLSDPIAILEDTQALKAAMVDALAAGWEASEEE